VADRRNKTIRDMSITMGVILIAVLLIAIYNGGFSFSPGMATGGTAPTADVQAGFQTAGRVTGFPAVVPKAIPADWHPNSVSVSAGSAQAPPTVRGGWLVRGGAYITLIESSGDPAELLPIELGPQSADVAIGSVTAGGANWTVSQGVRDEQAWWRTEGGVTFVITGDATPAEFSTLAAAVAG
jgi:hypothetical protein